MGVCGGGVVFLWTLRRVFPAAYLSSPWTCALTQRGQDVVEEIGNKKCTFYTQHTRTQTCPLFLTAYIRHTMYQYRLDVVKLADSQGHWCSQSARMRCGESRVRLFLRKICERMNIISDHEGTVSASHEMCFSSLFPHNILLGLSLSLSSLSSKTRAHTCTQMQRPTHKW